MMNSRGEGEGEGEGQGQGEGQGEGIKSAAGEAEVSLGGSCEPSFHHLSPTQAVACLFCSRQRIQESFQGMDNVVLQLCFHSKLLGCSLCRGEPQGHARFADRFSPFLKPHMGPHAPADAAAITGWNFVTSWLRAH